MTPEPIIHNKSRSSLQSLEAFLDRRVLPYPVKFLTNRIVILATLALLVPLIFFTTDQAVVNALNSYLNVMSVVVSSTVLLYATIADVRDRAAAQRREEIADEYQKVLEERVEAEHVLNEKILELAAQNNIQNMHVERLAKIRTKDRKQAQDLARAYEQVLEKRVQAQELVLEKRVQAEHELNEQILGHAVENSIQNILVENLEKLRAEDIKHVAELAREYEQVLEKRVQAQEQVLEKRVQAEHELIEKILQSTIENVLGERLKMTLVEDDTHMNQEVIASLQSVQAEVAALAHLVETLRPRASGQK